MQWASSTATRTRFCLAYGVENSVHQGGLTAHSGDMLHFVCRMKLEGLVTRLGKSFAQPPWEDWAGGKQVRVEGKPESQTFRIAFRG